MTQLSGCAGHPVDKTGGHSKPSTVASNKVRQVRVRKGDTLYAIAWKAGLDYRTLARWNGIKPPYTIYPGQVIKIYPAKAGRTAGSKKRTSKKTSGSSAVKRTGSRKSTGKKRVSSQKKAASSVAKSAASSGLRWIWPVRGKIVSTFSSSDTTRDGIRIAGTPGKKIVAAEAGEVVYVGTGLIGYGKLIIIKHNSQFLSAYGHNSKLLVKEGQTIKKGQHIADMGTAHNGKAVLYFEIREYGKPRNPLNYLPE